MALTDNIVSYWKFNESSGNASDSAGSNTLTNNNTATYSAGKIANGVNFVRTSSQFLSITNAAQTGLNFSTDFTMSVWFKFTDFDDDTHLAAKGSFGSSNKQYDFQVINATTIQTYVSSTGVNDDFNNFTISALSTGVWYYFTWVRNLSAGTQEVFVNAVSQGTSSGLLTTIFNGTGDFVIGVGPAETAQWSNGSQDETGIWSRALSTPEITSLYNGGAGLSYPFTPSGWNIALV